MCWRPLEYRVYTNIFAHKYRSCIIVRDIDRGETNPGIGDVLLKKKIIFLMIASVFLAFFNNLTFLFGTCYPGNTTDDMFVSSIFDSIKVVKTHSLTLGMQNLFVLIVFIFVMHDYLSREILNQGVYALVRMHRRTKWLVRRMAGLAVICAVYMGIYLTIVYELSSYYVHKRLVIPHSAVLPKAWLALFMMVYFAAVFTVVSDIRIGRSASCIVGAVVLAALIMIGMYEPYRKYKDTMWMLALNPACAMFVYTTAGKIGFMKMLTVFVGEITALILACAKWLEHIDLIKIESEGY